ncbi:MAG: hypothetical protein HQL79_08620 [Magnetococcales bacterium]|nr:hypothetical protein [Magnetococcales bacterium]
MNLERALQLEILLHCRKSYPDIAPLDQQRQSDDPVYHGNIAYLCEHGLIECPTDDHGRIDLTMVFCLAKITVQGLDFLEDDGGISAILKTVTVKLDPGDLRTLLSHKVENADLSGDVKKEMLKVIKALPAELLKKIAQEFLQSAVDYLPNALQIIQKYVFQ